MNKKELAEIRKNFNENSGFFTLNRVLTAYIDPEKETLFTDNRNYALIPEDEGTVIFETLRKVLGGKLGKNLVEYAFPQKARDPDGAFHDVDMVIHNKLDGVLENDILVQRIANKYECSGAYAIIIGYCTYSITSRDKNDEEYGDNEDIYNFIVTAICPACTGDDGLIFDRSNASIIKKSNTDLLISRTPTDGFLYPVFSDRQPDVNSVMYYTKTPKKPNISMIEDVLNCDFVMTCQNEKAAFREILSEVLGDDLSYTIVTQVNEKISEIAANYKGNTELPKIGAAELTGILSYIGIDNEKLKALPSVFEKATDGANCLTAANLVESKVTVKALGVTVSVDGIAADHVRASVQSGRKCIVIDFDDPNVTVNDIDVRF